MPYQYTFEKKIKDNEPHLEIHGSIMVTLNIDMTFDETTMHNMGFQIVFMDFLIKRCGKGGLASNFSLVKARSSRKMEDIPSKDKPGKNLSGGPRELRAQKSLA